MRHVEQIRPLRTLRPRCTTNAKGHAQMVIATLGKMKRPTRVGLRFRAWCRWQRWQLKLLQSDLIQRAMAEFGGGSCWPVAPKQAQKPGFDDFLRDSIVNEADARATVIRLMTFHALRFNRLPTMCDRQNSLR